MSDLLAAVGGREALTRAVAHLYERVTADELLAPFFAGVELSRLRAHMVDFLSAALGTNPATYRGRDMRSAHAHLEIRDAHFDRVAGYLVDVLNDISVDENIVDEVLERIAPLRPFIVARSTPPSAEVDLGQAGTRSVGR